MLDEYDGSSVYKQLEGVVLCLESTQTDDE